MLIAILAGAFVAASLFVWLDPAGSGIGANPKTKCKKKATK